MIFLKMKEKVRIVLVIIAMLGVLFTLINVSKDCNSLILTTIFIWGAMQITHESRRFRAILHWIVFGLYVVLVIYVVTMKTYNVVVLLGLTFLNMYIIFKRLQSNEIDYL